MRHARVWTAKQVGRFRQIRESSVTASGPKVAIVHEWLEHYAGSERVVGELLRVFPQADLFAVVDFLPKAEREFLGGRKVTTTFIQKLPFARRHFRNYLGLMPLAVEQFDLAGYDLVFSSHHAVAKGIITGPDQIHISYVHSPMRYAWDMQASYLRQSGLEHGLKGFFIRWLLHRIRNWDVRSAAGVDAFVANSAYIARRIRKVYRREAEVIHPPVDVHRFMPAQKQADRKQYLVAARQVPYKRVDLVVEAFRLMPERELLVVGDGPEHEKIAALAAGAPNITLRGKISDSELLTLMQQARAFVFAAEEDFGITLVEAQACGTPLITYGRGGALDIVREEGDPDGVSGVLFREQTAASIAEAVGRFETIREQVTTENCRGNSLRFSREAFQGHIESLAARLLDENGTGAI
ncbi:glycosyltransferase [Acetobacter fallax]|uniref:Glycosyltransferase n=1 Tax=Acetobacter fallax TaxID=1737473 RepID=A0ABX0KAE2_9PROT|nr:glycosyltransferase [Acetobacter fallax]NHO30962.1 glycosyltransferase [Acetobacter fallax]NHO34519.1 glycosyltransferase [Acetobacter fallax]